MPADDVRARFEASVIRRYGNAPSWIFDKDEHGLYTSEAMQTEWNGYRAAHADLSGEMRKLVEAVRSYRSAVDGVNSAMRDGVNVHGALSAICGAEENLDDALAKFDNQEKL